MIDIIFNDLMNYGDSFSANIFDVTFRQDLNFVYINYNNRSTRVLNPYEVEPYISSRIDTITLYYLYYELSLADNFCICYYENTCKKVRLVGKAEGVELILKASSSNELNQSFVKRHGVRLE
ncbi:hypothetical protein EON65_43880 [archaeon]|nr:MAG: hypothetical protein EON65_43880 [archaeon]